MQALDSEHPSQNILNIQASQGPWPIYFPLPTKTEEADDETLIHLLTTGSKAESQNALETIFVRHHKDVWRYVRSRVSSAIDTDEIASAVWLVVLEKIYDFKWTGVPVKSWLLSIAHRKVLEFFNTPSAISIDTIDEDQNEALHFIANQLHLFEYDSLPNNVRPTVKKEADEILHKMIAHLPDTERRIIMLIYFEGVENATDVAKRLGMNKNTIRVYHKRVRDKLRKSPELSRLFNDEVR